MKTFYPIRSIIILATTAWAISCGEKKCALGYEIVQINESTWDEILEIDRETKMAFPRINACSPSASEWVNSRVKETIEDLKCGAPGDLFVNAEMKHLADSEVSIHFEYSVECSNMPAKSSGLSALNLDIDGKRDMEIRDLPIMPGALEAAEKNWPTKSSEQGCAAADYPTDFWFDSRKVVLFSAGVDEHNIGCSAADTIFLEGRQD